MDKNYKVCLVGKIKGLAVESKKARRKILSNKSDDYKSDLALQKLFIGKDARHHMLAYGFLRGKKYSSIESKHRKENTPCAQSILNIIHSHVHSVYRNKYTIELIKDWLKND